MRPARIEVTGGFLLLCALLYYVDAHHLFLPCALAALLHEMGHLWAISFLGGRLARLRLSVLGAELLLSSAAPLSPLSHILSALSGPAVNLLLAAAFAGKGGWGDLFSGVNFTLAFFNLLPARQLDGGRALSYLLPLFLPDGLSRPLLTLTTALTGGFLAALGVWGLSRGGGLTLLLAGSWLLSSLWLPSGGRQPFSRRKRPPGPFDAQGAAR